MGFQISCTSAFGFMALCLKIRTAFTSGATIATGIRIFKQKVRDPRVELQEIWNEQAHAQSARDLFPGPWQAAQSEIYGCVAGQQQSAREAPQSEIYG